MFVSPHQRCGCSDLPFVRIQFHTAVSGNEMEGLGRCVHKQDIFKEGGRSSEKSCTHLMGSEFGSGSAGVDNAANLSCER